MEFSLTILGSGGALPTPERHPTAQCLQAVNQYFLIDAGEGVQVQLARYKIAPIRIRHIFISHLHGDHYLGLMGLLFSMHLGRRQDDLHLYSHAGLDEIILLHLKHARSALTFKIHFHVIPEGQSTVLIDDDAIRVVAFPVHHRIPCSGFLFTEKPRPRKIRKDRIPDGILLQHLVRLKNGETIYHDDGTVWHNPEELTYPVPRCRSYAFCSDTAPHPSLQGYIRGVQLIYHEATFLSSESTKAEETFHSTARQAAEAAQAAGAEHLLIGHISGRYKDHSLVLDEARAVFPATQLATEGLVFELPDETQDRENQA